MSPPAFDAADRRATPRSRLRGRIGLWGPPLALAVALFVASTIPNLTTPGAVSDKNTHAAAYGALSALLLRALAGGRIAGVTAGRAALAMLMATGYGVSDEWHQSFVPGRVPETADVLADAIGASAAAAALWAWSIISGFRRPERR